MLTDSQIYDILGKIPDEVSDTGVFIPFARAVIAAYEAKLREQNDPIGVVKEDCNGFPWKRIGYTCETDLARLPEGTFVYEHPAPSAPEGWISVEDRLPDPIQMVLVVGINQGPHQKYTTDMYCVWFNKDGDACSRWPNCYPPTHWMKLPAPPMAAARSGE